MENEVNVNAETEGEYSSCDPMTKKEILRRIKSEEKTIAWREWAIEKAKYEIRGCRKAIAFWNAELKKIEKKGV